MKILRLVGVLAGLIAVVVMCAVSRMWWMGEVDHQVREFVTQELAAQDWGESDAESGDTEPTPDDQPEKHPKRTLTTHLTVAGHSPNWKVTGRFQLRLSADDPLLADIRRGDRGMQALLSGVTFVQCDSGSVNVSIGPGQISQPKSDAEATVTSKTTEGSLPADCSPGFTIRLPAKRITGTDVGVAAWDVDVRCSGMRIASLTGVTRIRQEPTWVAFRAKPKSTAAVLLFPVDSEKPGPLSGRDELVSAFQYPVHGNVYGLVACAISLSLVAGLCVIPLVRVHAPVAARRRWTVAVTGGIVITAAVYVSVLWSPAVESLGNGPDSSMVAWTWFVLPFLLVVMAVRALDGRPPGPRPLLVVLVPSLVACAGPVAYVFDIGRPGSAFLVVALGALLTVGAYLLAAKGFLGATARRWKVTVGGTAWLLYVGVVLPPGLPITYEVQALDHWQTVAEAQALFLLWLWAVSLWYGARLLIPGFPRSVTILLPFALWWTLGAAWPSQLVMESASHWEVFSPWYGTDAPAVIITLAAFWGSLVHLFRVGRIPGAWPANLRLLAIGLAAATGATHVAVQGVGMLDEAGGWIEYAAVGAAVLGTAWLLPPSRSQSAGQLHAVSERLHTQAVERLLRAQTLDESRRQFLTASRAELAEGKIDPTQWDSRWRLLSPETGRPPGARHLQSLRRAALGNSAGRAAWRNALAAATLVVVVALPISAYRAVPLLATQHPLELLDGWTWVVRWIGYGVIYGYAYPWLRGGTPVGKAMCLFVTILPVELLPLLYQNAEPRDFGIALLQLVGNSLAACLVLGLYWEARVVRAAGLRWGQIRNFRSLSALAVPTTTVLVAVLTAVATTVAGTLLAPTQEQPPSDEPSSSASATPG
ncbi:hypothetical protein [Streptomyces sp. NPDC057257]|uniref:hypothetical protein n=1 Tax=Streptomyces sp. NPDC057257 TaxID=3346071 RepID=UPI00363615F4